MMTDYPNPYLNTDYGQYQDPYSNTASYDNYYEEKTDESSQDYREETYADSKDEYEEKYDTERYHSNRYDMGRYSGYGNLHHERDRYDAQEERDRQSRRNRSERRRHMRREDGRRDDRRDDRRDERRDDRRDDRGRERDYEDRDRDRDRDRDSTRSRDHSRDSERSSHSDRDRERDRDRDRDKDRRDDDRAGEKWVTDTPTNTILLRGLPVCIEEKDIRAELMLFGAPIKDVRLMRKSSGTSRGFAFVEFQSVDDALRWMDTNQKKLVLQNQYTCSMNFSTPKDRNDKAILHKMDWNCSKCGAHNFKRRDHCFGCNLSRYESGKSQADGYDHVGTNPCNTLLFRGLDALTTEENLLRALNAVTQHTCKNVQVIRDATSQMSAGYAFVELSSVAESMNFLDLIKALKPGFEVDGKQILVSFAKNTFNTSIATIAASQQQQQQQQQQQSWDTASTSDYYQGYDYGHGGYDQSGYYSGQYYENYDYSSYYDTTSTVTTTTTTVTTASTVTTSNTTTDATNAAAAVAQAAIQQAQAAKHYQKQIQKQKKIAEMTKEERLAHQAQEWKQKSQDQPDVPGETKTYPPPDVSLYQYDETSGYYYDPVTTLYYDANSQYYYNGNTGQFLYWDAEQSTYLPAPTNFEDSTKTENKTDAKDEKKEAKEKKEKVKVAKKIAKDMEKWAKSMNAQKEALKDGIKKINMPNLSGKKESATADAGFAILEKTKNASGEDKSLMPPPPPVGGSGTTPDRSKSSLVASYGGDSDEEEEESSPGDKTFDESKLLDFNKMACLLCKRQFQSKDILTRHAQMSDLHKENLEALRQSQSSGSNSSGQYRDRAKERREKIGSTAPPPRKRPSMPEPFEQPTKAGIGEDNIGSKMLQKMGWSSGQGLGKKSQGIVKPIQAERRSATAGLGMRGASYNIEDTDNYKDALRKTMFARYKEFE